MKRKAATTPPRKKTPRPRAPLPPPGRPHGKAGYDRDRARKITRREIDGEET